MLVCLCVHTPTCLCIYRICTMQRAISRSNRVQGEMLSRRGEIQGCYNLNVSGWGTPVKQMDSNMHSKSCTLRYTHIHRCHANTFAFLPIQRHMHQHQLVSHQSPLLGVQKLCRIMLEQRSSLMVRGPGRETHSEC